MPDWNRWIVGDAFKLPSRDINYYRDMFLVWPILLFSFAAIIQIAAPSSPEYRIYGFKLAACAIVAILLAKERLVLILAGAAYIALRSAIALALTLNWRSYLAGFLVSGGIALIVLRLSGNRIVSYKMPPKRGVLTLAVIVAGLGAAFAVAHLLKP
ncbi:MAG TPA: hypothetical protein VGH17_04230 [Candidatus Acidoferrales bacterium]|jgi:hypothetical protein